MAIDTQKVRSLLNDLIQTCKDGQEGFLHAAHHVQDANARAMFLELSQQRSGFAGELQQEVTRLRGLPETTGTTTAALHRGWVDFKAKITGQSDQTAIREAERGEDVAVNIYREAMEKDLPGDIRDVLEHQFGALQDAHRRVRLLEVGTSAGSA
jgi:uncharacterized protein (TIGR02284 family)